MFSFSYLDKSKKSEYLPLLFDALYSNMQYIAPSGLTYEDEKSEFLREVGSALEKEPRKIVLCYSETELVGFLMYYTRENLLMIEELQIVKKYQRTRALKLLCKYMMKNLPENIEHIESFVHKSNVNSISLQKWLGMEITEEINDTLLRLQGNAAKIKSKIR